MNDANLATSAWDPQELTPEDEALLATASALAADAADGGNLIHREVPTQMGMDPEYDPIEAVCETTGYTYNRHLPKSPWIDNDGKQAY